MALTARQICAWCGPAAMVLLASTFVVVACRCGDGGAPADSGRDEAWADEATDATAENVDGPDQGDEPGDAIETTDGDAPDAREEYEAIPCEISERDVRVWERTVGECWRDDPPARDLSGVWFEPEPGCEQITYGDYNINSTMPGYDVWGDAVAFTSRGIYFVDAAAKTERIVEPLLFDESTNSYLVDTVSPGNVALDASTLVYDAYHQRPGRAGEAPSDGCYVIAWDRFHSTKRLAYLAECPFGDNTGEFLVHDMFGARVIGDFYEGPDTTQENVHTIDVETLENVAVTSFPFGEAFWDVQVWEDTALLSLWGRSLILADLAARTTSTLDLGPGNEWRPAIHEGTACWLTSESSTVHGDHVKCMDFDARAPWLASNDATSMKYWPTVFGDWVAWGDVRETSPGTWDQTIGLYHRGRDLHVRLSDRTSWFSNGVRLSECPKLSGDHVYFLVWDRTAHTGLVYRCDLRVLFPEAYW